MPYILLASLIGGLAQAMSTLVGRVLVSLGIGLISYTGIQFTLDFVKQRVFVELAGLPPDLLQVLGLLKIGHFFSIIMSAVFMKLAIKGMTGFGVMRLGLLAERLKA